MPFTGPTLATLEAACPSAEILADGLDFLIDDSGVDTTMRFWVLPGELPTFRATIAGVPATTISIGGASVTRLIPMAHPYEPNCYAYSLRIVPAPGTVCTRDSLGQGFKYADYFCDVKFRTPKYDFSGTGGDFPMVTVARQSGVDMVTRPGSAYRFPSDGTRLVHEVGVPVGTTQYSMTFHRLPALDNTLYDALRGCVNLTTFFGKDPGTMLFLGCSSSGELTLGGFASFEATLEFSHRTVPHNQVMRPDGAGFESPVEVGSGNPLLPIADLTALYT
jgi:hypothetical protein